MGRISNKKENKIKTLRKSLLNKQDNKIIKVSKVPSPLKIYKLLKLNTFLIMIIIALQLEFWNWTWILEMIQHIDK